MKVLIACEESQVVCKEFRKLGHEAYSCDLVDCTGGHPGWHLKMDSREAMELKDWDLMIAHPPCDRLANSGVRWLTTPPPEKTIVEIWKEFFQGCELYRAFQKSDIPLKCIENPVMHRHAKQELNITNRQVVQPWWFGDETFKATGYELFGLPELKETNRLTPPSKGTEEHKKWSWVHRMAPGPDRKRLRSVTPKGIARAMAEQWGNL
jgi:hypothetical protein